MSTIKVNKIENTSTTAGGVAIDVDGHVKIDGQQLPTAGPLSNRNMIINGAMQVAQRATQVTSVTTTGYRTCDRMEFAVGTLGTWTVDQSTDSPQGFSNSFKVTCTTADATPSAGDAALLLYLIEGQDLQHLNFGTNNAQPLTLSFWVKSNKTGDASIDLLQPDASDRLFSATYNISAADEWEYKTIPIPADTAGQINNDSGSGLRIDMWINGGSNYTTGTTQDWGAFVNANRNSSNLGVGGAVNDYWQITGLQLEVGSKATPFEHRSYGDELQKCKRYYQTNGRLHGIWYSPTSMRYIHPCSPTMRAAPTTTLIDTGGYHEHWNLTGYTGIASLGNNYGNNTTVDFQVNSDANRSRSYGDPAMLGEDVVSFSAEL